MFIRSPGPNISLKMNGVFVAYNYIYQFVKTNLKAIVDGTLRMLLRGCNRLYKEKK